MYKAQRTQCARCLQTDPAYKIGALLLIDSICQNVGEPYVSYFSTSIGKVRKRESPRFARLCGRRAHCVCNVPSTRADVRRSLEEFWADDARANEALGANVPRKGRVPARSNSVHQKPDRTGRRRETGRSSACDRARRSTARAAASIAAAVACLCAAAACLRAAICTCSLCSAYASLQSSVRHASTAYAVVAPTAIAAAAAHGTPDVPAAPCAWRNACGPFAAVP